MCWFLQNINMNQPKVYICPLPPEPPSHLPPHPAPLGCHRALGLSSLRRTENSHWLSILHIVVCMFQCYSPNSSHPLLPLFHQVCALCLHLSLLNRVPLIPFLPLNNKVKVKSLSRIRLSATPWTVAYQAPASMGFSRQEYWSGLPFPSPGDLPDPGIEPWSPSLQGDALTSQPPGKPFKQQRDPSFSQCIWDRSWVQVRFLVVLQGKASPLELPEDI